MNISRVNTGKVFPASNSERKNPGALENIADSFTPVQSQDAPEIDIHKAAALLAGKQGQNIYREWTFEAEDNISHTPAVGNDGSVFVGDGKGNIKALDGKTGDVLWIGKTKEDSKVTSLVFAEKSGNLFMGTGKGEVCALDPKTGKKIWAFKGQLESISSILEIDDKLVVKSSWDICVLDSKTGKKLKEYGINEKSYTQVFFQPIKTPDGMMISGGDSKSVFKVDPSTGKKIWEFDAGASVSRSGAAVGKDGTVYFGCGDMKFYAVDRDGNKKWEFQKPRYGGEYYEIFNKPMVGPDNTVYVRSSDHYLYAFDGDTGKEKWKAPTGENETGYSAPVTMDKSGNIVIGGSDGRITAFDSKTGKRTGTFKSDKRIFPTISFGVGKDGELFIPSFEKLFCMNVGFDASRFEKSPKNPDGSSSENKLKIEQGKGFINIGGVKLKTRADNQDSTEG